MNFALNSLTTEAAIFFFTRLFRLCTPWVGGWLWFSERSPRDSKAKKFTQDIIHANILFDVNSILQ